MFSDTPVRVTDTPISTGSLTGSALVFHKTSGDPFTVTYTVDAVARTPTDWDGYRQLLYIPNDNTNNILKNPLNDIVSPHLKLGSTD